MAEKIWASVPFLEGLERDHIFDYLIRIDTLDPWVTWGRLRECCKQCGLDKKARLNLEIMLFNYHLGEQGRRGKLNNDAFTLAAYNHRREDSMEIPGIELYLTERLDDFERLLEDRSFDPAVFCGLVEWTNPDLLERTREMCIKVSMAKGIDIDKPSKSISGNPDQDMKRLFPEMCRDLHKYLQSNILTRGMFSYTQFQEFVKLGFEVPEETKELLYANIAGCMLFRVGVRQFKFDYPELQEYVQHIPAGYLEKEAEILLRRCQIDAVLEYTQFLGQKVPDWVTSKAISDLKNTASRQFAQIEFNGTGAYSEEVTKPAQTAVSLLRKIEAVEHFRETGKLIPVSYAGQARVDRSRLKEANYFLLYVIEDTVFLRLTREHGIINKTVGSWSAHLEGSIKVDLKVDLMETGKIRLEGIAPKCFIMVNVDEDRKEAVATLPRGEVGPNQVDTVGNLLAEIWNGYEIKVSMRD